MAEYESIRVYIQSGQTLEEKICKIEAIIDALEDSVLAQVELGQDVSEYNLDDGQTKIRTVNRSVLEIKRMIDGYEQLLQRYANRLNGHVVRLVDFEATKYIRDRNRI